MHHKFHIVPRGVLLLTGMLFSGLIYGQQIKVGIFNSFKINHLSVSVASGAFVVSVQNHDTLVLKPGQQFYVGETGGTLEFGLVGNHGFQGDSLLLVPALPGSVIKVQAKGNATTEYWYEGQIDILSAGESIKMVNTIDLEGYIAGVVEAETGGQQTKEFYKVQACITRTFALANLKKHLHEGFNLCDQVHCQVYKGRSKSNPAIPQAVAETEGVVVVDRNLQLVDAVFHSNCGGQTHNSEDYWVDTIAYLRSVKDPYCSEGLQYNWQQKLAKEKWLRYLYGNYNYPVDSLEMAVQACNYVPSERSEYFLDKEYKIGLRRIRSDWNFRSTFFEVHDEGEQVLIKGRGFGHGVGLCQEGAMKMAKTGISYVDILHFYFQNVFIVPKKQLLFLRSFLVN